MTEEKYQKRHYYPMPDNSNRKKKFRFLKRKKKRLSGVRNDVTICAYIPLIYKYIQEQSKLDRTDLDTICYLSRLNRTFDKDDFMEVPNQYRERRIKKQMARLVRLGIIERWEGHNMNHGRKVQYKLTRKGRGFVFSLDNLILRIQTISLDPGMSSMEFVTPRVMKADNKYKENWYSAIKDFNNLVEKEKGSY